MGNVVKSKNCFVKVKSDYYDNGAIGYLVRYVAGQTKKKKEALYTGGFGVDSGNISQVVKKMLKIKKHGRAKVESTKKKKSRQLYHWIVSFGSLDDKNVAIIMSNNIACYLFGLGFQVYYGLHDDTDKLHSHFIMNSTSFIDGKKFHVTKKEENKIKHDIQGIIASVEEEYYC